MDEQAMATRLEDTIWHSESPTADVNGMARLAMSEIAHARGIKVVLTGEGADEHFSGYADFWADRFREPDQAWPSSLSEGENLFDELRVGEAGFGGRLGKVLLGGKDWIGIGLDEHNLAVIGQPQVNTRVAGNGE